MNRNYYKAAHDALERARKATSALYDPWAKKVLDEIEYAMDCLDEVAAVYNIEKGGDEK